MQRSPGTALAQRPRSEVPLPEVPVPATAVSLAGKRRIRQALPALAALLAVLASLLGAAPATAGSVPSSATVGASAPAAATEAPAVDSLRWTDCGDGFECATARVPRDYDQPDGATLELAVIRLPASSPSRRIGSLFVNFGGPGAPAVDTVRAAGKDLFGSLNDRFDIVGFDPRGVGRSRPAIDCKVNQETEGLYAQPFPTPSTARVSRLVSEDLRYVRACVTRNAAILPHVSTANVARDMDYLRAAVGDEKLSYLGFSYGTFLGATYASLFPDRYRALVLDGALDPSRYINRPLENSFEQTAGFERALGRFLQACAADQRACQRFGGKDPWKAYDTLLARLDRRPLAVSGGRRVDGDDARAASALAMYSKQLWPVLARALSTAEQGDGTTFRALADAFYGREPDGTYDPGGDRFFAINAAENRWPRDPQRYLEAGRQSWGSFDHFWWNTGYTELAFGLFPVRARDAYYGPFRASRSAAPVLVVGTTYDPATPYRGALRAVAQLGNARLLTMSGDGHTAYGGNSPCIDRAVNAYLEQLSVPARGTTCEQQVRFAAPDERRSGSRAAAGRPEPALRLVGPLTKPLLP